MKTSPGILSFILIISALACYPLWSTEQTVPSKNSPPSESTWQLLVLTAPPKPGTRLPFIHFSFQAHEVTGNTGCNNFSGTFKLVENSLSFNNDFTITKMSCPGINERAFFNNLFRTSRYDIRGDTLLLRFQSTPLSYWIRVK